MTDRTPLICAMCDKPFGDRERLNSHDCIPPVTDNLMEELAALEHERWSRWHKHAVANWTSENIARWNRQAETPYEQLSEREKESDRKEVAPYWKLLAEQKAKIEELEENLDQERQKYANAKNVIESYSNGLAEQRKVIEELVSFAKYYHGEPPSIYHAQCDYCRTISSASQLLHKSDVKHEQV